MDQLTTSPLLPSEWWRTYKLFPEDIPSGTTLAYRDACKPLRSRRNDIVEQFAARMGALVRWHDYGDPLWVSYDPH